MKKYIIPIIILACFAVFSRGPAKANAQVTRFANPLGGMISYAPGTTITNATVGATTFFTETIPANGLYPVRWYHLTMRFKATTPALGIPGLTTTFQYGSQTYTATTGALLVGGQTNALFTIDFYMVATANSAQTPFAIISQPNGTILNLTTSNMTSVGSFTVDSTTDQTFSVVLQLTGTGLGTTSLTNFWYIRDAF